MRKLYALGLALLLSLFTYASKESCIVTTLTTLDSTAIRSLNSSPVVIIPSPGAGFYTEILKLKLDYTAGTQPYPYNICYLFYGDTNHVSHYTLSLIGGTVLSAGTENLNDYELLPNVPVYLKMAGHNVATGNGSLKVYATYRYVSLTGKTVCDSISPISPIGGICTDIFHLNSAQIKTLNSSPVNIIPAPPAGYYTKLLACDASLNYAGTPYSGNTTMVIYTTDSVKNIGTNVQTLLDNRSTLRGFAIGSNSAELGVAVPVKIKTDQGNTTTGNSDLDLYLTYKLIQIGQSSCTGTSLPMLDVVKDTVTDLTSDSITLTNNFTHIVVAAGTCVNLTFGMPTAQDNDAINIILTEVVQNVLFMGNGINSITPMRRMQLLTEREMTLRWTDGGWR